MRKVKIAHDQIAVVERDRLFDDFARLVHDRGAQHDDKFAHIAVDEQRDQRLDHIVHDAVDDRRKRGADDDRDR